MNIPDFLATLFAPSNPYALNEWIGDLWQLVYNMLSWDIVKGGLTFILGVGIALYAVLKIRQAFGGG